MEFDQEIVGKYVSSTIVASLTYSDLPLRHDPDRTTSAIIQALSESG